MLESVIGLNGVKGLYMVCLCPVGCTRFYVSVGLCHAPEGRVSEVGETRDFLGLGGKFLFAGPAPDWPASPCREVQTCGCSD